MFPCQARLNIRNGFSCHPVEACYLSICSIAHVHFSYFKHLLLSQLRLNILLPLCALWCQQFPHVSLLHGVSCVFALSPSIYMGRIRTCWITYAYVISLLSHWHWTINVFPCIGMGRLCRSASICLAYSKLSISILIMCPRPRPATRLARPPVHAHVDVAPEAFFRRLRSRLRAFTATVLHLPALNIARPSLKGFPTGQACLHDTAGRLGRIQTRPATVFAFAFAHFCWSDIKRFLTMQADLNHGSTSHIGVRYVTGPR